MDGDTSDGQKIISRTYKEFLGPGMVVHSCNPATQEVEVGESQPKAGPRKKVSDPI
jgi:hypothetical protein